MEIRRQGGGAHPLEHLSTHRITAKISAEKDGIDTKTDQPLCFPPMPIGDEAPDAQVFVTRVAIEKDFEGGQESHEKRVAFPMTQILERFRQRFWEYQGLTCGAEEAQSIFCPGAIRGEFEPREGGMELL